MPSAEKPGTCEHEHSLAQMHQRLSEAIQRRSNSSFSALTYAVEFDDDMLGWKKTAKQFDCGYGEIYALKYRKGK